MSIQKRLTGLKHILDICGISYTKKKLHKLENLLSSLYTLKTCQVDINSSTKKKNLSNHNISITKKKLKLKNDKEKIEDSKSVTCVDCFYAFNNKNEIAKHAPKCTGSSDQNMPNDLSLNESKEDLERTNDEKIDKNEKSEYICEYCSKAFNTQWTKFQKHVNYHIKMSEKHKMKMLKDQKEKTFDCNQCSKSFATSKKRISHINNVHQEKKCKICNAIFDNSINYHQHMKYYHDHQNSNKPNRFNCGICEKVFRLKADLTLHNSIIHEQKSRKTCPDCGKLFFESEFEDHIQNVHLVTREVVIEIISQPAEQNYPQI